MRGELDMMNRPLLVAMLILLASSASAFADCGKDPECDDLTKWSTFNAINIDLSAPDSGDGASWRGRFDHKTFDMTIDVDVRGTVKPMKGTIAMVGGRVMMSKGLTLDPGYEIDAIDGPVLYMKLVTIILGRIHPKGPSSISGEKQIDRKDKIGIKYATPSASGYIPAPWRVTGKVRKLSDGSVAFDLALTMPLEGKDKKSTPYTMKMKGTLAISDRPVFTDSESLEGWTTYGVGPQVEERGGATIYDYGAKPDKGSRFKTIGDVRAYIAEEQNPGVKDSTKDFTGFWKTKCEDAFGVQIKPFGSDGLYSIVFCGPGGCGDPAEGRKTFITGDKNYQVVSEDELVEIRPSGKRETILRCTRDTHPILKY